MRIAIFGLGGVGGYFGGRLAQTNQHEVIFIARGNHLRAIQEYGLYVYAESGDFIATPTIATADPDDVGSVDVVVVATKAWQLPDAIQMMHPMVADHTVLIPLLNGVEAPAQLADVFGNEKVLGGFCRVMSKIEKPGHIQQGGIEPFVAFGEMNGDETERVRRLRDMFEDASISVMGTADIQAAMWQKMLFIASFGGVASVTRMTASVLQNLPETRAMLLQAMQEIHAVAQAHGVAMLDDAVERGMASMDTVPANGMASMQRDILAGRPSELEAQNGAIVRLGREVGVSTPLHQFIYYSLLPGELQARGKLSS